MQKIILKIERGDFETKDFSNIECFALDSSVVPAEGIIADVQKNNKIVLSYGPNCAEHCKKYKTDGLILDLSASEHIKKDIDFARKIAGNGAIIGTIVRSRRHETMIAAECEPDFIIFKVWEELSEKQKELFDWYQEFFLLQDAVEMCAEEPCSGDINADILLIDEKKYKILVAMKKILE